jgi:hypothetical protein
MNKEIDLDLGLNPFCFEQKIKIETKKRTLTVSRGTELVEKNTTDIANTENSYFSNIVQTKEVDREEFIKLYTSQIKAYFDLTKTAYKVFFIFLCIYQDAIGKDCFYLSCKKAMNLSLKIDQFILSESIFYRGIKELIEKKIIAKTNEKNWYFINPAIVFNGDRARFISEIIKKKEEIKNTIKKTSSSLLPSHEAMSEKTESVNNLTEINSMILALERKKRELEEKGEHNAK